MGTEKPGLSYMAGGNVKWHSHAWEQCGSFLQHETIICHMTQQVCSRASIQRKEDVCSRKNLCTCVQSSFTHNNKNTGRISEAFRANGYANVVHANQGALPSGYTSCRNFLRHVLSKRANVERRQDSTYTAFLKRQNYSDGEQISSCQRTVAETGGNEEGERDGR